MSYPRWCACVLGVAMIACGGCGSNLVTLDPQSWAPILPGKRAQELRVMSFNVRVKVVTDLGNYWTHRRDLLGETVKSFDPDLLGAQEVLYSQAQDMQAMLPEYGFVGAGRNDGKRSGEMCPIFYKTARYTLLEEGHFWLSEEPQTPGSKGWGAFFPRMVTWAHLRPRSGRGDFYVFNTHLDAFNSRARLEASRLLRERIERIAVGKPVVLTGDFNTDEDTEPYEVLTMQRTTRWGVSLIDTLRAVNPIERADEGTRHGFNGGKKGDRIDWILVTPDFQTLAAGIDHSRRGSRYPSDHFPVTAVLRWRTGYAALPPQPVGLGG